MSDRLFVSTRKGLFVLEREAKARWRIAATSFLGTPVSLVLPDARDGSVHAAVEHGHFGTKVHRSTDGGRTFAERTVPAYPPQPEGEVEFDPIRNRPVAWALKSIWALEAGLASQPGRLWAGTIPGGLFRSDDSGESWHLVRSLWDDPRRKKWFGGGADLPSIHSVCVDPRDGKSVTVGVSCGGSWFTADDGATWELRADGMRAAFMPPEQAYDPNIQDPHCIVQCAAAPDTLWAQHHNGIFKSTNRGRKWTEIEKAGPSTFGFAVAVHPKHPDTAWFVPGVKDEERIPVDGRVVVTRTRDGGKTFDVLREGLPQEHAYDLTYRHGLAIDATGERLAFGSTTGSLWVTENGGDAWAHVSAHLPPVFAVRFG